MMSLTSILKSKSSTLRMLPPQKEIFDVMPSHYFVQRSGMSTGGQSFKASDRVYAPYHVYKGKAALSAEPVLPRFSKLCSGGLKVDRRGGIMLTFSPAVGERKYDWERKQMFSLSATEIGSIISLGPNDSCELFHDPAMQTSNAGQVRKSLSIKPHADGSGYFVSLSVANSVLQTNERFTVPITSAEFSVMRQAFSFALPYIMGWHRYTNQLEEKPPVLDAPMQRFDLEWDK